MKSSHRFIRAKDITTEGFNCITASCKTIMKRNYKLLLAKCDHERVNKYQKKEKNSKKCEALPHTTRLLN